MPTALTLAGAALLAVPLVNGARRARAARADAERARLHAAEAALAKWKRRDAALARMQRPR